MARAVAGSKGVDVQVVIIARLAVDRDSCQVGSQGQGTKAQEEKGQSGSHCKGRNKKEQLQS